LPIASIIPYQWREEPPQYRFSDSRKLRELKDRFKGERCFIVGNGPSLNLIDLSKLESEYSFAVNGIFYKTDAVGFTPTFYVVEDSHVVHDNLERINSYDAEYMFFPTQYRKLIKNRKNTTFFRMNTGYYKQDSPNFKIPRFSTDISRRVFCGQSVTMMNLQLAFYFGFKDVYLIGMDFNYQIPDSAEISGENILSTEDDPNHFHPEYFGAGKSWHDPHLDRVKNSYELMRLVFESAGRSIFNASVGGKLEVFERVDFETLFGQ
jgi:hypothetical protein